MRNLDLKEVILYDETLPLGYSDVELERKILMNTYRKEGIREGEEKVKKAVATYMVKIGYSVEDICAIIDLNPKIIEKLKS